MSNRDMIKKYKIQRTGSTVCSTGLLPVVMMFCVSHVFFMTSLLFFILLFFCARASYILLYLL